MAGPALTGSCGCGAVKFEIDEPLVGAIYCHCTRCQRRTGGASSATALVRPGTIRITQGEDKVKAWAPEGGFRKHFCADCGSAVFGGPPDGDDITLVRLGVVDGDPGVRPIARQFVAYAAPWEPIPDDGLPRYDERMPLPDRAPE
jgi:hypothetical protein